MINNKLFWYGNMAGAVAGWIFIFSGALFHFTGGIHALWLAITLIWGIGHPLELAMSMPIARKAGFSLKETIVNTLVFGITWWIPVKLGVLTPES
jgi:hypothetical protein